MSETRSEPSGDTDVAMDPGKAPKLAAMDSDKAPKVSDYSAGSALEKLVGGLGATIFSAVYIGGPLWILFCLVAAGVAPRHPLTLVAWVPLVISILVPPIAAPWILKLWIFQCIPKYFQYREIVEIDDESLGEVMKERAIIFTAVRAAPPTRHRTRALMRPTRGYRSQPSPPAPAPHPHSCRTASSRMAASARRSCALTAPSSASSPPRRPPSSCASPS